MAVFTPVDEADIEPLMRRLGLGRVRDLVPIAEGVENTNFRLETDQGRFILTLFERRTDEAGLPFCLGLTGHAADHGLPCARPLKDAEGRDLFRVNGRPAAVLDWLPGAWVPDPSPRQLAAAGAMLARLHLAGRDFDLTRPDPVGAQARRDLFHRCHAGGGPEHAAMLERLAPYVADHASDPSSDLPSGPIHADWFADNVLFEGDEISGVIDFYLGCTGAFAYDLAIALSAWGFTTDGTEIPGATQELQAGYEGVRPLTEPERLALPRLGAIAAVRFTLTRLHDLIFHDPTNLVTPKDPVAFLRRLDWWEVQGDSIAVDLASTSVI